MANVLRFALLMIACLAARPAGAAESTMGPLTRFLTQGVDGAWTGSLSPDAYRLENKGSGDEVRYFQVNPRSGGTAFWTYSVEIMFDSSAGGGVVSETPSLAGLVFALKQNPRFYLAFLMDDSGKLSIYRRNQSGWRRLTGFGAPALDIKAYNELRIVETTDKFEAFANGKLVGSVGAKVAGSGGMGIIAGGPGVFQFRKFHLAPTP